jgi:hypothetical protein
LLIHTDIAKEKEKENTMKRLTYLLGKILEIGEHRREARQQHFVAVFGHHEGKGVYSGAPFLSRSPRK